MKTTPMPPRRTLPGGALGRSFALSLALLGAGLAGAASGQVVTEFPITSKAPSGITSGPDGNLWFTEQQVGIIGRLTPAGVITEFTIPTAGSKPRGIAAGSDGNLWFTENGADQIGRITTAGVITEYPIPSAPSLPDAITSGPDGNLWFTELSSHTIARITTAGVITEFFVPQATSGIGGIAAGPDGNIWFTYSVHVQNFTLHAYIGRMTTAGVVTGDFSVGTGILRFGRSIAAGADGNLWFSQGAVNQIGRITTAGVITEFPAAGSNSAHLSAGPDGNVWFTEFASNRVGQITPAGAVSDFPIPTVGSAPAGIVAGSDGNLWFTESARNKVGQITTAGVVAEFPIPVANTNPVGIAAGPDGDVWFTEVIGNKIGRIGTAGGVAEFSIPTANSRPRSIALGPDGNIWFTESDANQIGRITTGGVITEFPIPTANSDPMGIASGPDGNLWFTEAGVNQIGRITAAGAVTEYPVPTAGSSPWAIAAGPDANLWFVEYVGSKIGRISTAGVVTEFNVPTAIPGLQSIAAGPDGNLWFTNESPSANLIGRITTAGAVTEFPIPTASSLPRGIAAGPDGNLWFAETHANQIGRITTAGVLTELDVPTAGSDPRNITAGPDGNLWFTEGAANQIGRITTAPTTPQQLAVDAHAVTGSISNANGVLEPGETVLVDPFWLNTLTDSQSFTGTASHLEGPAGPTYSINDSSADYGTVGAGATGDCLSATFDCYLMTVSGARPAVHWDAAFTEDLSSNSVSKVWTLHMGGSFTDVSTDIAVDPYYPSIETILHNQVSVGCQDGTKFCPADPTTRQEMAVFLLKASQGSGFLPPACAGIFSDVPCTPGAGFPDWIENLYNRGITAGCQPGDPPAYCPTRQVLRSEMAVFLLKASLGSAYDPPPCSGIFTDVPCTPGVGFADWIEDLWNRGVTSGCQAPGDPLMYCPDNNILRQEMAVFLAKVFGLQLYGP